MMFYVFCTLFLVNNKPLVTSSKEPPYLDVLLASFLTKSISKSGSPPVAETISGLKKS